MCVLLKDFSEMERSIIAISLAEELLGRVGEDDNCYLIGVEEFPD